MDMESISTAMSTAFSSVQTNVTSMPVHLMSIIAFAVTIGIKVFKKLALLRPVIMFTTPGVGRMPVHLYKCKIKTCYSLNHCNLYGITMPYATRVSVDVGLCGL